MEKKLADKLKELLQKYPDIFESGNFSQFGINRNENAPIDIDYSLVKHIDMGKSGIATAEQPLIATDSLATCTGILAYDLENGFAFLAHSDAMVSFMYAGNDKFGHPSISKHVQDLKKICDEDERYLNLTVEVLLGTYPDRNAIDIIKNNFYILAGRTSNKYRIVSINEIKSFDGSILFDSRTGKRYVYDKRLNPFFVPDDSIDKRYEAYHSSFTSKKTNGK